METLTVMGQRAKTAAAQLAKTGITERNNALKAAADALLAKRDTIQAANAKDIEAAKKNQMKPAMIDRLTLTDARIEGMAEGLYQIVQLDDPIGEITSMKQRPNGLMIGKKKVPLGVIAIIYESRPNVTADAFGLTLKSGNAVILRGGSDAIHSNTAIVSVITESLKECGINPDAIQLVTDTDRALVTELMHMNKYIDIIIPRGGAGLIQNVVQNSTVPVIETGTGNCHIYVDEYADFKMAEDIIFNAKTQRIGVCNACESLVIHEKIVDTFMPKLTEALQKKNVELHADERSFAAAESDTALNRALIKPAVEEDWGKEYLDYMISAKTVASVDEAIEHINRYNTGHSEAIITENYTNAQKFLDEVDAACVYVNASTRFSDGFEFGFGAEIGISTQKLHARGPMGLEALTSTKYIIYGNGQVRP